MNSILLVDDDNRFAKTFTNEAANHSMTVIHKRSYDGLKEVLPAYQHKIAAVVLDIRCLVTNEQEREEAGFISVALRYLDQYLPNFPRFILTGDDTEFENFRHYFIREEVFLKTPQDFDRLFERLLDCINNYDVYRIKREYPDVFELFDGSRYNDQAERLLIKILKEDFNKKDFADFKGAVTNIRSMQETVYKVIHQRNKDVVPDRMFKPNGMVKFNELMHHLSGYPENYRPTKREYQNGAVCNLAKCLYWCCGQYVHEDPHCDYFISSYTIKSLVYNLLELLLWSKQYLS